MPVNFKGSDIESSFTAMDNGGQAANIVKDNPNCQTPNDYGNGPNGMDMAFYMSQPQQPQPAMKGSFEDVFNVSNAGGPPKGGGTQPSMTDSQVSSSFTPTLK